jgi:phytoene desaturase
MGSAFEALKGGRIMPDPSRLVTIPSLDDPITAPAGCSTLYLSERVTNLDSKINWSTEAKPLRERLHAFLATHGYPSEVITEHLVTPLDWQAQGWPPAHRLLWLISFGQTGSFRPSNVERRLPGTIPGVGVPMVMISGKLAASRVATSVREQAR